MNDEHDHQSTCQARKCRASADINVFGIGLCWQHWTEAAESGGLLISWMLKHVTKAAYQAALTYIKEREQ